MRLGRRAFGLSFGIGVAASAIAFTATARANTFGPSGCCYYADNSIHTYFNNG